ncbi:hypothetical protein EK21DRAFT_113202 [Setomelanomma holmii]|uniref:Uncharacterized protein n=1 Tax=Setomelanomma holmii TaxID=210430 RepID=A0A9P4H7V7_9PLEO|nr:hypothetical protein EK21DRAFT_113202 [Setomelanomma holmii]
MIVCAQSEVLDAASRFGREAAEDSIDLSEEEPDLMEYRLRCMYQRDSRLLSDDVPGPFWVRRRWIEGRPGHSQRRKKYLFETRVWRTSACIMPIVREFDCNTTLTSDGKVLELHSEKLSHEFIDNLGLWHAAIYTRQRASDYWMNHCLYPSALKKFEKCMRNSFAGNYFYDAVGVVFTTTSDTDKGLRDLVVGRIIEEKEKYHLSNNSELDEALKEILDLISWVVRAKVSFARIKKAHRRPNIPGCHSGLNKKGSISQNIDAASNDSSQSARADA